MACCFFLRMFFAGKPINSFALFASGRECRSTTVQNKSGGVYCVQHWVKYYKRVHWVHWVHWVKYYKRGQPVVQCWLLMEEEQQSTCGESGWTSGPPTCLSISPTNIPIVFLAKICSKYFWWFTTWLSVHCWLPACMYTVLLICGNKRDLAVVENSWTPEHSVQNVPTGYKIQGWEYSKYFVEQKTLTVIIGK